MPVRRSVPVPAQVQVQVQVHRSVPVQVPAPGSALVSLHVFVVPGAGSLPKNLVVHWPLPETDFCTQPESAPNRTS